jgi:periplasmic divalent cation tolerance protein
MPDEILLVLSAFAERDSARRAAKRLVEERLAACANIVAGVESIYRWKNAVETAGEVIVIFKTTSSCRERFEQRLRELHPYEVPEIVALQLSHGSPDYLRWVAESCDHSPSSMS